MKRNMKIRNLCFCVFIAAFLVFLAIVCVSMTSCNDQSDIVSYNVSKEADNFNICRRLTVINSRTDTAIYELEGFFSLKNNYNDELEVICRVGENDYRKHFIYLTDTVLYVVEDIGGTDISPFHYKITFYPQMIPVFDPEIRYNENEE